MENWCKAKKRLKPLRLKELFLFLVSLFFYGWALFGGIFRLCLYILFIYVAAWAIQTIRCKQMVFPVFQKSEDDNNYYFYRGISIATILLAVSVAIVLLYLFYYKYQGFIASIANAFLQRKIIMGSPLVPLGISFITFSAISYLVDVYNGKASAGNLLDCALYLSFFPKVVSGPIVLWKDFQPQIWEQSINLDSIVAGLEQIMIGFAKKLIMADMFGACILEIQETALGSGIDAISAWGAVLLYMLQIYYDFAGYSDIAIGTAQLFGFSFKKNFDFPYCSKSMTEFWRRWHISLGTWFREYIYIPLGGNRKGTKKTLRNLAVVFLFTGIWHGAGWNYILWGVVNGGLILLERVVWGKSWYQRIPDFIKWLGTMFIIMLLWELFRFQSLTEVGNWISIMLGITKYEGITFTWRYFFDFRMICLMSIGILGATVLGKAGLQKKYKSYIKTKLGYAIQEFGLLLLFGIAILCMVNSNYSPFIYFQY